MKNREPFCRCHIDPSQVHRIMSTDPDGWIDGDKYIKQAIIWMGLGLVMLYVVLFVIFS